MSLPDAPAIPAWFLTALDAVLEDLGTRRSEFGARVEYEPTGGPYGDPRWLVWLKEDGSAMGLSCDVDDAPGDALLHRLAHTLTDQFISETRRYWVQPRPACPGHGHPARADFVGVPGPRGEILDGEAWWTCPADGRALRRIGRSR